MEKSNCLKAYISIFADPDEIELRLRVDGPSGTIGDALRVLKPGGSVFGLTYEQLLEHGNGVIDLPGKAMGKGKDK